LSFYDANFFAPGLRGQKYAQEFARLLIESRIDVRFMLYARANDVKEDTFKLLREAGLFRVFIGIESFSPSMLKRLRKGVTLQDNFRSIELCQQLGILIVMGFITFDHDTSLVELQETLMGLKTIRQQFPELLPEPSYLFGLLEPLPNTAVYDEYWQRNLLIADKSGVWSDMFVGNLGSYNFADPYVAEVSRFIRKIASYTAKYLGERRSKIQKNLDTSAISQFQFLEETLRINNIAIDAFDNAISLALRAESNLALRAELQELAMHIQKELENALALYMAN